MTETTTQVLTVQAQTFFDRTFVVLSGGLIALDLQELSTARKRDRYGLRRICSDMDYCRRIQEYGEGSRAKNLFDGCVISIPIKPETHQAKLAKVSWGRDKPWRLWFVAPPHYGASFHFASEREALNAANSLGFTDIVRVHNSLT